MSFYHDNDFADRCAASVRRRVAVRFFCFFPRAGSGMLERIISHG